MILFVFNWLNWYISNKSNLSVNNSKKLIIFLIQSIQSLKYIEQGHL